MQRNARLSQSEVLAAQFWSEENPTQKSCNSLRSLLEIYAAQGRWSKVTDKASQAVLHLNDELQKIEFYYMWICALRETQNEVELIHLANHLHKMSSACASFDLLSSIAFNFAGKKKIALRLLQDYKRSGAVINFYYKEALGLYLSTHSHEKYVRKGLMLLIKNCDETTAGYLNWRNCLRELSFHDYEENMSEMYNLMHVKFPFSPEPYLAAALIAMDEKNWGESIRLLSQLVKDNPSNSDAVLALADCLQENAQAEKANLLLKEHAELFHEADYDFHCVSARVQRKIALLNKNKSSCQAAIEHYDCAISLARFFNFPIAQLAQQRAEVEFLKNNQSEENNRLWSLESFLEKESQPQISSPVALVQETQTLRIKF